MENKGKDIINNTDGNINPSSAALAVTSLGDQITTSTDDQASSWNISDIQFDENDKFDLLEMFCQHDFNFGKISKIYDFIAEPYSSVPDQPAPALEPELNVNPPEEATQNQVTKQPGEDGEEKKENDTTKELHETDNTSTKNPNPPRYAFVTKSEIDVLDDGYRWRKYGEKTVKKSPFKRSYYRCTSAGCGVVKSAERSSEDHSVVVTTYVGKHNHILPVSAPRGTKEMFCKRFGFPAGSTSAGGCKFSGIGGACGCGNFITGIRGANSNTVGPAIAAAAQDADAAVASATQAVVDAATTHSVVAAATTTSSALERYEEPLCPQQTFMLTPQMQQPRKRGRE